MKKFYLLFTILPVSVCFINQSSAQMSVIMQHNDLKRTGWNNQEKILNHTNVNKTTFGKIFTRTVDDEIYAQPLIVSGIRINNKMRNVVFVATVNNSVYAFDADVVTANTPLWHVNLTYPGYRPVNNTDMYPGCPNYHNFDGKIGIVGTPALDTANSTLYVVARSVSNADSQVFVQYLHAINLKTGAEKSGSPVYITATVKGSGDGSVGGKLTFDQQRQNQRPGLLLYKGTVYIAWASHCDWSPYHGWILGYDAKTLKRKYVYVSTPEGGLGGIWMSGQAPSVDDSGFIYVSTGNGTVGRNGNPNDTINRGESLLKMSTASGKLKVVDFFTPKDYPYLEQYDLDYGIDGVLLIPHTTLSVSGSKESFLYLINNDHMGGTTSDNSNAVQVIDIHAVDRDSHIHGTPVYYKNSTKQEFIYVWCESGLLTQIPFIRGSGIFDTAHEIKNPTKLPIGMPGAMLSVSSNGSASGTEILWASHPLKAAGSKRGILQAFDASDVSRELWNSNQIPGRDSVDRFAKFVCPTVANGKVYLATFANKLDVYGLLPAPIGNGVVADNAKGATNVDFEVYPNPAKRQINIVYNAALSNQVAINVVNSFGGTVYMKTVGILKGSNTVTVDLPENSPGGIYSIMIIDSKGASSTRRIVIAH